MEEYTSYELSAMANSEPSRSLERFVEEGIDSMFHRSVAECQMYFFEELRVLFSTEKQKELWAQACQVLSTREEVIDAVKEYLEYNHKQLIFRKDQEIRALEGLRLHRMEMWAPLLDEE